MKKILIIFVFMFSICFAKTLDECYRMYSTDPDTLFMSALSAINSSSKFEISEIQSRHGNILFLYGSKYYLLTLTKRYKNQTEIKILPQNSDYSQGTTIAQTLFALIDYQLRTRPMESVK